MSSDVEKIIGRIRHDLKNNIDPAYRERTHLFFKEKIKNVGSGKTMKHLKISSPKEIDKKRIIKLLKLVEERQN